MELSTSPIFLALQVDPRLVGVPMVAASNGGTALREMALLKQQQLNPKQRLYEHFLNSIVRFNGWQGCKVDVPFIQLTLLSEHTDAKLVNMNPNTNSNEKTES